MWSKEECCALAWFNGLLCPLYILCLREFSKSLICRAYTWYGNLKPWSTRSWEHLRSVLNAKFFYANAKFSILKLSWICQHLGEDLNTYMKRLLTKTWIVAILWKKDCSLMFSSMVCWKNIVSSWKTCNSAPFPNWWKWLIVQRVDAQSLVTQSKRHA